MKRFITFSLTLAILGSITFSCCYQTTDPETGSEALLELDRKFSNLSREQGANKAFLTYIDEEAVLLRSNRMPIIGREKITEIYSQPDTGFILTWEPLYGTISKSGDLGYTYGIYTTESITPEGETLINKGTYVTIWKKDENGEWKFVLDTGNPGLERKKPDLN